MPRVSSWHVLNCRKTRTRREVDNGKQAAGFKGSKNGGVGPRRIGEMMVDPTHKDCLATGIGKIRFDRIGFHDGDVLKMAFLNLHFQMSDLFVIEFGCVYVTGGSDPSSSRERHRTFSRSDLRNHVAGLPTHQIGELC